MRASLRQLAGQRVPARARFAGLSKHGDVILEDIRTPGGREPYVWVRSRQWKGQIYLPGTEISFSARVGAYNRDSNNTWDLGFVDIEQVQEV